MSAEYLHPGRAFADAGRSADDSVDAFSVSIDVIIRPCRAGDLPTLEWFGLFSPDRQIIRNTYDAQLCGDSIMLIAEVNSEPAGQIWIDLTRRNIDSTGVLWALRVFPCLQNLGIGTRLFNAAQRILEQRRFARAELGVERSNIRARQLYERLGYKLVQTRWTPTGQVTNDLVPVCVPSDQLLMRKNLAQQNKPREKL